MYTGLSRKCGAVNVFSKTTWPERAIVLLRIVANTCRRMPQRRVAHLRRLRQDIFKRLTIELLLQTFNAQPHFLFFGPPQLLLQSTASLRRRRSYRDGLTTGRGGRRRDVLKGSSIILLALTDRVNRYSIVRHVADTVLAGAFYLQDGNSSDSDLLLTFYKTAPGEGRFFRVRRARTRRRLHTTAFGRIRAQDELRHNYKISNKKTRNEYLQAAGPKTRRRRIRNGDQALKKLKMQKTVGKQSQHRKKEQH